MVSAAGFVIITESERRSALHLHELLHLFLDCIDRFVVINIFVSDVAFLVDVAVNDFIVQIVVEEELLVVVVIIGREHYIDVEIECSVCTIDKVGIDIDIVLDQSDIL